LITANDLPTGAGTPRPVTLRVDMTRVRPSPESEAPAELVIETLKEDRVYQVVVEPFVTREAYVDVAEGILGKVPGYTCTPLVPAGTQLQVHGPLSRVEALGGRDGKARLVPA